MVYDSFSIPFFRGAVNRTDNEKAPAVMPGLFLSIRLGMQAF